MPSTFGTLEIGKSALFTNMKALNVVAHNISNANTPEYARQRPDIVSRPSETLKTFASEPYLGQVGSGAGIDRIQQYRDMFLDGRLRQERSSQSYWSSVKDNLQQVEYIMSELSDSSVRTGMSSFFNALSDVVENPVSVSTRTVLKETAVTMTSFFNDTYENLDTLRKDINTVVSEKINQVNVLADKIAELNREIGVTSAQGTEPNDLRDHRELALKELSEIISIDVEYDDQDKVIVRTGTRELVNRIHSNELKVVENKLNDGLYDIRWADERDNMSYDTDVVSVAARPSAPARNYTITVNNLAKSEIISSAPVFPDTNASLSSVFPGISSGSLTINGQEFNVDADNTSLREFTDLVNNRNAGVTASWEESGPGAYSLSLKSDITGIDNEMSLGLSSDKSNLFSQLGFITGYDGSGKGIKNNAQIIQSASDASFDLFDGVSSVTHSSGVNRIDDFSVIKDTVFELQGIGTTYIEINPTVKSSEIKALLDVRDYEIPKVMEGLDIMAWELGNSINKIHFQGFGQSGQTQNNLFTAYHGYENFPEPHKDAARYFSVDQAIIDDPSAIAASKGILRSGAVLPESLGEGNSENMLEIFNFKDVKAFSNNTANIQDYYISINSEVGILANNADTMVEQKEYVINNLDNKRQEVMGVNLDEEMAELIKYQQSYAAASRFMSSFNSMLDALIGMV
jgi:flagellar hook-associated protein 1 FlgK